MSNSDDDEDDLFVELPWKAAMKTKFPPGSFCVVCCGNDSSSSSSSSSSSDEKNGVFSTTRVHYGVVQTVGIHLASEQRENIYQVELLQQQQHDKAKATVIGKKEHELQFAPLSPVWFQHPSNNGEPQEAIILCSEHLPHPTNTTTDVRYTVRVLHQSDQENDKSVTYSNILARDLRARIIPQEQESNQQKTTASSSATTSSTGVVHTTPVATLPTNNNGNNQVHSQLLVGMDSNTTVVSSLSSSTTTTLPTGQKLAPTDVTPFNNEQKEQVPFQTQTSNNLHGTSSVNVEAEARTLPNKDIADDRNGTKQDVFWEGSGQILPPSFHSTEEGVTPNIYNHYYNYNDNDNTCINNDCAPPAKRPRVSTTRSHSRSPSPPSRKTRPRTHHANSKWSTTRPVEQHFPKHQLILHLPQYFGVKFMQDTIFGRDKSMWKQLCSGFFCTILLRGSKITNENNSMKNSGESPLFLEITGNSHNRLRACSRQVQILLYDACHPQYRGNLISSLAFLNQPKKQNRQAIIKAAMSPRRPDDLSYMTTVLSDTKSNSTNMVEQAYMRVREIQRKHPKCIVSVVMKSHCKNAHPQVRDHVFISGRTFQDVLDCRQELNDITRGKK